MIDREVPFPPGKDIFQYPRTAYTPEQFAPLLNQNGPWLSSTLCHLCIPYKPKGLFGLIGIWGTEYHLGIKGVPPWHQRIYGNPYGYHTVQEYDETFFL